MKMGITAALGHSDWNDPNTVQVLKYCSGFRVLLCVMSRVENKKAFFNNVESHTNIHF